MGGGDFSSIFGNFGPQNQEIDFLALKPYRRGGNDVFMTILSKPSCLEGVRNLEKAFFLNGKNIFFK